MEKNMKKNIYIYILNHFAIHLKLTQYCKSTIVENKQKPKPNKPYAILLCIRYSSSIIVYTF